MAESALCLHCDQPVVNSGGVWRHAITHNGSPLLTRWCLDRRGYYIWPAQHAFPADC